LELEIRTRESGSITILDIEQLGEARSALKLLKHDNSCAQILRILRSVRLEKLPSLAVVHPVTGAA
jgi:hypothetical protein